MRLLIKMVEKKVYEDFELEFEARQSSRKELRDFVVKTFLEEKGGYRKDGVKHVTRYKYFVEKLHDGRRIFLLRPTFLNKGIDFQVWVEKFEGGQDKRPSHKDILQDIRAKLTENKAEAIKLLEAIREVWNCKEPEKALETHRFNFENGFPVELLLKALKWLFIEQDITYWNYDGRAMLFSAIMKGFDN